MTKTTPEKITEQPPIPDQINLPLSEIAGGGRLGLRQVDKRKLSHLIKSIKVLGLINPLTVVKRKNPHGAATYVVLCGHNRFEACEAVGLDPVPCRCVGEQDAKNPDHKIMQADENLARVGLTNDELETHLAHRKFWYEVKYPEAKQGGAPGAGRGKGKKKKDLENGQVGHLVSFASDTAAVTGMPERTVRRLVERGEKIDREVSASLTNTELDTGTYRNQLKNVPKDQQANKVQTDLDKKKEMERLVKIGAPVKEISELTGASPHTIRRAAEKNKLTEKTISDGKAKALEELADFGRFKSFFKTVIIGFSDAQRKELISIAQETHP